MMRILKVNSIMHALAVFRSYLRLFVISVGSIISCFCLAFTANARTHTESTEKARPNIVFIHADDLGYGDIGSFGANDVNTSNIGSLAKNGAKLTQFYSASPVCTPYRAALLTGRYPIRTGIDHVFFGNSYEGMLEAEVTIAEMLKPAGYSTAIIGKWRLGHHTQYLPLNQGFDEFFGIPYSNDMLPLPYMRGNDYVEPKVDQTQNSDCGYDSESNEGGCDGPRLDIRHCRSVILWAWSPPQTKSSLSFACNIIAASKF